MLKLLSICLGLCLLFSCSTNSLQTNLISGKVTRVFSGQTIEVVLVETSETVKVRITGIDAPDLRQSPWGQTAQKKLRELVLNLPISIEVQNLEKDSFNRINGHVWQDNTLISQQLVKEGYVIANTEYPHSYSKLLIDAQEYARLMGYGIWNPELALRQNPSQFRSKIK